MILDLVVADPFFSSSCRSVLFTTMPPRRRRPDPEAVDAAAARQDAMDRLDASVAALRDRVCAAKPGAPHEYRLAVSTRCVPVSGRALEAAQELRQGRGAAAGRGRGQGRGQGRGDGAASGRGEGAARSGRAGRAAAAVPVEQTRAEVDYLKRRLARMDPYGDGYDPVDLRTAVRIARAMSMAFRRIEFPDTMRRFEDITEKARGRGADAFLPLIFSLLVELLEAEVRAARA